MALVLKDRVKETTTTTGTGTISLAGAVSGYQAFSTIGNGNTTYYTIVGGTQWETGVGTYSTSGNTLARTTVLASSTGSAIDFAAGSKDVFSGMPADKVISNDIGTLAIAHGGTGATDASTALSNLGALSTTTAASTYFPIAGGAFTGGVKEQKTTISASDIDITAGNYFTKTLSTSTTFTVSNVPSSGTTASFILDLTNSGSYITWWSGVKWAGGTAPTLTASGRDVLGFFTHDGGTTWTGLVLGKDVK